MKNSKRAFKTKPNRRRHNISELEKRFGCSRQTIWRWYTTGDLPKPHYLGQCRVWFEDEIEEWEQKQMASHASRKKISQEECESRIAEMSNGDPFYTKSGSSPPNATNDKGSSV